MNPIEVFILLAAVVAFMAIGCLQYVKLVLANAEITALRMALQSMSEDLEKVKA